ncbi:MAG: GNAT family N-acetyltransferase, partial [Pedosphaera parvula]|nr:GNAT family N-acetyltransferase [Pedosphaera parvula]
EHESAGIIGAENIDTASGKLEMRKLVGNPALHGKGIGKRATFLFLYYVFIRREFNKVYLHSMDINIRNLNLNAKFGFELEGVFIEDALVQGKRHDLVRMGLLRPIWLGLFT